MREIAKVGDLFQLSDSCYGLVVASSFDEYYLDIYPKEIWENLDEGMMLMTNDIGLAHYPFDDDDLIFIGNNHECMNKDMDKSQINALLTKLIEKAKTKDEDIQQN